MVTINSLKFVGHCIWHTYIPLPPPYTPLIPACLCHSHTARHFISFGMTCHSLRVPTSRLCVCVCVCVKCVYEYNLITNSNALHRLCDAEQSRPGQARPDRAPLLQQRVDMANAPTALSLNYVPCARDVAYFSALSKDVTPADTERVRRRSGERTAASSWSLELTD